MKSDIPQFKVEGLAIAIIPRDEELWDCYILNFKEEPITNVLINSKGYGELNGESMKTSILRHFFERLEPTSATKIEPIQTALFVLTNEYWVSFNYQGHMYDKKYVFVKGSINEPYFTNVPYIEKQGVMIK